ncbi:hypothetical protein RND71_012463 [Anisodus tanguticus]|uniref:Uncharacterized protein n=1 Tax=Anisodus tanguticus TaxID=243964 RepID=A0AAE1SFA8_9SOLA|nr:hypothetical protein RND71_012463 [Anisodus tanguticus]
MDFLWQTELQCAIELKTKLELLQNSFDLHGKSSFIWLGPYPILLITDPEHHMLPAFYVSCSEMLSKWEEIVPKETSFEVDVWPDLQIMTSEVISRTAFGSSYEEGRTVFELQKNKLSM